MKLIIGQIQVLVPNCVNYGYIIYNQLYLIKQLLELNNM
jgi:hypothetical protein